MGFEELLGLSGSDFEGCENAFDSATIFEPQYTVIGLPANTSRHGIEPADCLAVVVDDVVTAEECADLRASGDPLVQYRTTAREETGEVREVVKIANPRR